MSENVLLFMGGIGVQELILLLCGIIVPTILWLIALIDVVRSNFADSTTKIIWVLIILLVPFLGPILYFIIGRKQKLQS